MKAWQNIFVIGPIVFLLSFNLPAQKKWIGGQSGLWNVDSNWIPNGVPNSLDDVVLDNSSESSGYTLTLPVTAVIVHRLTIIPATAETIRVVLPPTNIASPAFSATAEGDGLTIDRGAIFQNASGISSGQSLNIAGKLRINNGGIYIHNTKSAHANDIVAKLSTEPGTEEGCFKFDVPGASTTISLSNRVFGKLILSAAANGGTVTYSGSGVNPLTIQSDLEILEGVNFSISFSNTVRVKRHFIQHGGTFNIANAGANTLLAISGDVRQTGGVITKTGVAVPTVLLNGVTSQDVNFTGGIRNNITLKLDNSSGVNLSAPLYLPYHLELSRGKLSTSAASLLTLSPASLIKVDSASNNSFINGPVKKEALQAAMHFLFPVGKGLLNRWIALKDATGDYTVEYLKVNPHLLSNELGAGLDHVSSIETWSITAGDPIASSARVELSFDNVNSGGVTDLATLRVAQLDKDLSWVNQDNTAATGSAGASGSVTSKRVSEFNLSGSYFTLASSVKRENLLPLNNIVLHISHDNGGSRLQWEMPRENIASYFVIEGGRDDKDFKEVAKILAKTNIYSYEYDLASTNKSHFRLKVFDREGSSYLSRTIEFSRSGNVQNGFFLSSASNNAKLVLSSSSSSMVYISIYDREGKRYMIRNDVLLRGINYIEIDVHKFRAGIYFALVSRGDGTREVYKFIKL